MAKYSESMTDKIVHFIEAEDLPISEICNILSICRKTFYLWMDNHPEFCKEIERARERREEKLLVKARMALAMKLEKHMLCTVKYKYVVDKENPEEHHLVEKTVTHREYLPSDRTIKMVLELEEKRKAKKEKAAQEKQKEEERIEKEERLKEPQDENKPMKFETYHPDLFDTLRRFRLKMTGIDKEVPYTEEIDEEGRTIYVGYYEPRVRED